MARARPATGTQASQVGRGIVGSGVGFDWAALGCWVLGCLGVLGVAGAAGVLMKLLWLLSTWHVRT